MRIKITALLDGEKVKTAKVSRHKKPIVKLTGTDANVFSIIGICRRTLVKAGLPDQAKEMVERTRSAKGYYEAFGICLEYVDAR